MWKKWVDGVYLFCCLPILHSRKGVLILQSVFDFILSVMAGVVAYYICKWLDRDDKDSQSKMKPQEWPFLRFLFVLILLSS